MAYTNFSELVTFILILAVGIPLVYAISKALKLRPQAIDSLGKKREVLLSLVVFAVAFFATFGIYAFYNDVWIRTTLTADPIYVLRNAIWIVLIVLPMVIVLRLSGKSFGSIGYSRKNLKKSVVLGLLAGVVLWLVIGFLSPLFGGAFTGFSVPTVYLLISYIIIGFGEEAVFRGYIQTRLTANSGPIIGLVGTSLLYVVYNFPLGYFCYSGNVLLSVQYALWRFSTGLAYGYTYQRSQNVVSSSIFHTILVWGGFLFGLYF